MRTNEPQRARRGRRRMTSAERREQLIVIARGLFAERGFDGTSVEEIAAHAEVSKPVVYEHFGGKEGLYAVVVDREVLALETAIQDALATPNANYREIIERGTLALLDYIDTCPDGFRIIARDSAIPATKGNFASILSDITAHVEDMLVWPLARRGYNPQLGRVFAQGLVGLVASAGQSWLDLRQPPKEELAAQLVNLAWNGLANLEKHPRLRSAPKPEPAVAPATDSTQDPAETEPGSATKG
ncbi:AcrR family transcriptional regulator [Brooklawnia cerclae]|uniref:AcrR family transcriptional regulator n=1 Tax=Brooklawnia cerclae TaxID=349934 RepID=A0ABX0SHJ2_9ACTN|nr:AcrR family transcriptional regulator [Brooklawnia cerclae]